MKRILFVISLIFCLVLTYSLAMANFYVIASGKKAKRTILVSPKNTATESGTALLAALSGITDASDTNPYLIIIEPGVYNIGSNSLQMKSYVDMQGSGENVTKITGAIVDSFYSGVVKGANDVEIRFLTVENTGGSGNLCVGFSNDSSSPTMTHITATASGGSTSNYGVYNHSSSFPTMSHVTANASGAANENWGVFNDSSSPTMTHVAAIASGGSIANYGVYNLSSSPTMIHVTVIASGGSGCYGVKIDGSSVVKIYHSVISAFTRFEGGISYGVLNSSSEVKIDHSVISGGTASVVTNSTTDIGNTRLEGGVDVISGTCKCAGVYDEDYNFSIGTCPSP